MATKITRRQFVGYGSTAALGVYLASRTRFLGADPALAAISPQIPLPGGAIPQFVDPVPNLLDADHLIVDDGSTTIELQMREHLVRILPAGAVAGYAGTYVWSYLKPGQAARTSHIGPVILATRGKPTELKFVNQLGTLDAPPPGGTGTNLAAYRYSTDQTLHWADPLNGEANMLNHMVMPPAPGTEGAYNYGQDPKTGQWTATPIPACVHIHGGEVPPELDGGPDAWFLSGPPDMTAHPNARMHGHGFYSKDGNTTGNHCVYRYPNSGEGALIWFHDHTLGATRLNVYAGLAGGYLIADPADPVLATLPTLFPLVIQDRMFDQSGQLFFPADSSGGLLWTTNPEHPYWVPEFVGDTIVVNGKSWPFMNVEPRRYTFLLINGSNARTYEMALTDPVSKNPGPPLWVVGTDGGYLDKPVKLDPVAATNNKLVMMSGERYWVIVDFKGYEAGKIGPNGAAYSGKWDLKNTARTPYPAGATPSGPLGKIMRFVVAGGPIADASFNPAAPGATLRGGTGQVPSIVRLSAVPSVQKNTQKRRQLTLNEIMGMPQTAVDPVTGNTVAYPGGPLEILVNNTKWSGERVNGVMTDPNTGMAMYTFEQRSDFTQDQLGRNYLSELPHEGDTELWEIINLTADAHPIHLHLVQFQLVSRQAFDVAKYNTAYLAAFPGGGYDPMTKQPHPAGVFIPGFGPPLDYKTGNPKALGGNPDVNAVSTKGKPLYLQGPVKPPLPQENGWKDTVVMFPGEVTRILVRWAPTSLPASTPPADANFPFDPRSGGQGYVWHCHIVDHEDNEMMRPDEVVPNLVDSNGQAVKRTYVRGVDF